MEFTFLSGAILRDFTDADTDILLEMVRDLYTEPDDQPHHDSVTSLTISEAQAHPDKLQILVFEKDSIICGYAILVFFWSNEFAGNIIEVDEIYLYPALRNKGLATEFFDCLPKIFPDARGLSLCVNHTNPRAAELYLRCGFKRSPFQHMHMIFSK